MPNGFDYEIVGDDGELIAESGLTGRDARKKKPGVYDRREVRRILLSIASILVFVGSLVTLALNRIYVVTTTESVETQVADAIAMTHAALANLYRSNQPTSIPPASKPLNERQIAFVAQGKNSSYTLNIVNADGSNLRTIYENVGKDYAIEWSPDGSQLIFVFKGPDNATNLFAVDADGTNLRLLFGDSNYDIRPAWSPNGLRIALSGEGKFEPELFVINADGSDLRQLTSSGVHIHHPAWSPDGSKLAFVSDDDIYKVDISTGTLGKLINEGSVSYTDPVWSPDGTRIAFLSDRDGSRAIYMTDTHGSYAYRLTPDNADVGWFAWSPDGSRLAFRSYTELCSQIYVVNSDGSNARSLSEERCDDDDPAWLSDSERIIFMSRNQLYVTNVDNGSLQRITEVRSPDILRAISHNGSHVAVALNNVDYSTICLLDMTDGNPDSKSCLPDHLSWIYAVALQP